MSTTRPYQSPFRVTFDDMIESCEKHLKLVEAHWSPGWGKTHEIETQKKLIALLKRAKKDPQIDLFDESKKLK